MTEGRTYQDMLAGLESFWGDHGCVLLQPYHTEVGAGTMNPATFLRCLGPKPWKTGYVEPSMRPSDGRYGQNPFRFQHFYQYQVVLKPSPAEVLDLYFASLERIGIDLRRHDLRLVEDDWEAPTLGAWGLGWEIWIDGMEITQFTYLQQLGGFDVDLVPQGHVILTRHADVPGIVGKAGTILGEAAINISTMNVARSESGDALMVLGVDRAPPESVLAKLRGIGELRDARSIEL
jgi:hypothetical protein